MAPQAAEPDDPASDVMHGDGSANPPDFPTGNVYTMEEAARMKGVSYHTVSRAVRSGKLPCQRLGRMNYFTAEDLDAWQPMRNRAPTRYRRRKPEPISAPPIVDLASGERIELARRLTSIYGAIHTSAMQQSQDEFLPLLAEQFATAMSFNRVAIWLINEERTEIEHIASHGTWYAPGDAPDGRIVLPFDPVAMYLSASNVYDGITCWTTPPPMNTGPAFSAALVVGQTHIGYIIGDRDGMPFSLSGAQILLGQSLATQAAITIDLVRTRLREAQRTRQLEAVLERISEPVMVYTADRRITALSRAARRVFGLPDDLDLDAEPFSLADLDRGSLHHRGVPAINPPSALALAGQVVHDFEFTFVRDDTGEERLLLVDAVPILEDGKVVAVVAVERDITDQRATEALQRRQREQLERALERTRALADIPLALNAGAGLRTVLRDVGRKLTQMMGGKVGGVGLLLGSETSVGMWSFTHDGIPDELLPLDLRDFTGTLRAFEAGGPILNTYQTASEAERRIMDAGGTRSNLITPLVVEGELVGAMYINYEAEDPQLTDEMIAFNTALAAQCSLAIKRAHLHRELETERQALQRAVAELKQLTDDLAGSTTSGLTCSPEAEARIQRMLTAIDTRASGIGQ